MSRNGISYLITEAFRKAEPMLVHGTSVEAAQQLLRHGRLPSSYYRGDKEYRHPVHRSYLFFVPNTSRFFFHPKYDDSLFHLGDDKDWYATPEDPKLLVKEVQPYAEGAQRREFLRGDYWAICRLNSL